MHQQKKYSKRRWTKISNKKTHYPPPTRNMFYCWNASSRLWSGQAPPAGEIYHAY